MNEANDPILSSQSTASVSNASERMLSDRIATSPGFPDDPEGPSKDGVVKPSWKLWLHVKWNTTCYLAYAEYYFEAWVTSTADPGGPRTAIDQIDMRWRHGDTRGRQVGNAVDMVGKDDRTYAYGFSCDSDLCTVATATHQGVSWSAATPNGCAA